MMKRARLGNLYALKISNGEYVYMRLVRNGYLQIFKKRHKQLYPHIPNLGETDALMGLHYSGYRDKRIIFIGKSQTDEANNVPLPATYMPMLPNGNFQKYQDGKITQISREEALHLQPTIACDDVDQLIEYIENRKESISHHYIVDFGEVPKWLSEN